MYFRIQHICPIAESLAIATLTANPFQLIVASVVLLRTLAVALVLA